MSKNVELSQYQFSGAQQASMENLHHLPQEDQQRLLLAGIDVHAKKVSGSFMHLNHGGVHCHSTREGLEILDIKTALQKYDGLPQYYWNLLDPHKDEFTRMAYENLQGGYFIRVRKGVKIPDPVQSCLFIKGHGTGQSVHNIVVVEEGAELNILGGCATDHGTSHAAHIGMTEFYVEKGGKLSFTMVHNWGKDAVVRPRSAGVLGEDAVFQNNYVLLEPVANLQMNPSIRLQGSGGVARFNSVIVAPENSYVDSGNVLHLDAPHTRGEIIARTLTTGGTIINRGLMTSSATPTRGHLECKGLILGGGRIHAIPELDTDQDGVDLSHEAAVGKIAQHEIEYLMARGMDEDEATSTIVRGFLNVDIMGLPQVLQDAIDDQIRTLNENDAM